MSQVDVIIDIDESDRSSTADALFQLLADSYTLYLKTHNYHWNVTGPHFGALHALFGPRPLRRRRLDPAASPPLGGGEVTVPSSMTLHCPQGRCPSRTATAASSAATRTSTSRSPCSSG